MRGRSPAAVWHEVTGSTADVFTGDSLGLLYLGAAVLGITIGLLGYILLKNFWALPPKRPRPAPSY